MKLVSAIKFTVNSKVIKALPVALLFFWLLAEPVLGQMSSGSYKIPSDSINVGGRESSSSSYKTFDTTGEIATGTSSSTNYKNNAGFIQTLQTYLAISSPADVTLTPSISGVSGGTGTGSATWNVTTDNAAGYTLSIKADTSPALASAGDSFADYTPVGANPDYTWSIASTDSEFGYTPEGVDIAQAFKDNGSSCNVSTGDTADRCWFGFSTSDKEIARRTSGNHPNGTTTTVKMQAEAGADRIQLNGSYTATVEVTLLAL